MKRFLLVAVAIFVMAQCPPTNPSGPFSCDAIVCAAAWSVDGAMVSGYNGPLFQLGRLSDHATLDVGMGSNHLTDLSTWSAFCGGVQSNCIYSKLYNQIHPGLADLVPYTAADAPIAPCVGAGPTPPASWTCATAFEIDPTTGLPQMHVGVNGPLGGQGRYFQLGEPTFGTGIVSGRLYPNSVFLNATPIDLVGAGARQCCGWFGISHTAPVGDAQGTDFIIINEYRSSDPQQLVIGIDEEFQGEGSFLTTPYGANVTAITFNPAGQQTTTWYFNNLVPTGTNTPPSSGSPGSVPLNFSNHVHLGGGGDLSAAAGFFREGGVTNNVMSASDFVNVRTIEEARFPTLTFH